MEGGAKQPPIKPSPDKKPTFLTPGPKPKSDPVKLVSEALRVSPVPSPWKFSPEVYARRNPKYPNGFQPSSVRAMFGKAYNTPSDSDSTITVDQQLTELSSVENRELLETGFGASDQCKSLGIANTECFLCGFSLKDERIPHEKPSDFGYPQCEHLLPAAAALFMIGLVNTTEEGKSHPGTYIRNYLFAHNGCNQEKGSRLFLSISSSTFTPDGAPILVNNIKQYLNDLYTYSQVIRSIISNKDEWIEQRTSNIVATYTPLSKQLSEFGGVSTLIGVTNYIRNIDFLYSKLKAGIKTKKDYANRMSAAQGLITLGSKGGKRKTFKRKNNGRIVRKTTIRRNVTASHINRKVRAADRKRS